MSLVEVLPEVQSLSRLDKLRLIQFLAQELERDDGGLIEPGQSYPVWSPDRAFSAAAVLLQALEENEGSSPRVSLVARPFGLCAGAFVVPNDFDAPLPDDILREFEGR